jgi:hypothetical protein
MTDDTKPEASQPGPEHVEQHDLDISSNELAPNKTEQIVFESWSAPLPPTDLGKANSQIANLTLDMGSGTPAPELFADNPYKMLAASFLTNDKSSGQPQLETDKPDAKQPEDRFAQDDGSVFFLTDAPAGRHLNPPDAQELEAMRKLVEYLSAQLEIMSSGQLKEQNRQPDIIIDRDGVPHLNPDRKEHNPNQPLVIEIESTDPSANWTAVLADQQQKATVRDLISFYQMQHPGAPIPADWLDVLSKSPDLPPPGRTVSGGAGGGTTINFRSGDGGGFSGSHGGGRGAINGHIPQEVPPGANLGHATKLENNLAPKLKDSLNLHQFVDRVVAAVSGNEGNFKAINGNDGGYGISVGIRQWNQKVGELPTLLKAWQDKDPAKFDQIFGQYAKDLQKEGWVRNTNFHTQPGLMDAMKTALGDKEFQDVQVQLAREFVVRGIQLGIKYGFKSELALAEVVDIANQKGMGGCESALRQLKREKQQGLQGHDEAENVRRLETIADRPHGNKRLASLEAQFRASTMMDS